MAAKVGPKIALDFKLYSPSLKITFTRAIIANLTGVTTWGTLPVTLANLGTQTDTLETIEEKFLNKTKVAGDKQLRDAASDDVDVSLTAIAHHIEFVAWNTSGKQELAAEQLILTTGFHIVDKITHAARNWGLVKLDKTFAQVRSVKTKKGFEITHWQFGYTTALDTPPVTTKRHTSDNVNMIITGLSSGSIVAVRKSGQELSLKIKKYAHPTADINADEDLIWSEWLYFQVP